MSDEFRCVQEPGGTGLSFGSTAPRVHAVAGTAFDHSGFCAACAFRFGGGLCLGFVFVAGAFFESPDAADTDCSRRSCRTYAGFALAPRRFRFSARFTAGGAFFLSNGCHFEKACFDEELGLNIPGAMPVFVFCSIQQGLHVGVSCRPGGSRRQGPGPRR